MFILSLLFPLLPCLPPRHFPIRLPFAVQALESCTTDLNVSFLIEMDNSHNNDATCAMATSVTEKTRLSTQSTLGSSGNPQHSGNEQTSLGLTVSFMVCKCLETSSEKKGVCVGRGQALGPNHRGSSLACIQHSP